MVKPKSKSGFLSEYRLDETYLLRPDRAKGHPGIIRAQSPRSDDLLIKMWPRAKSADDQDLEVIWRSEVRQLLRLSSVPHADDLLVNLRGSGRDDKGYYLLLDLGQGSPLQVFLDSTRKPRLLAEARQPRARRVLWTNILRLVQGVELLHSQGIIHRNIDPWSVITTLGDEPDFQLTGFEWSMRVAAIDAKRTKKIKSPRTESSFSFARDWRDLALLSSLILEIPIAALNDQRVIPSRVAEHAPASEIRLLRAMLGLEHADRLDGEFIQSRVSEIIDGISTEVSGKDAALCLSVRLGNGSSLSEAIRRASGNEIEISDEHQQIRFLRSDLGNRAQLVGVNDYEGASTRYVLLGQLLTYRLTPYRKPGSTDEATWEFAYSDRADPDTPSKIQIVGDTFFDTGLLDIILNRDANQAFPRRRGKVQHWSDFHKRTEGTKSRKTDNDRVHQAFTLLLLLEMAYAAADVFPVQITSEGVADVIDQHVLHLVSRHDAERAKLSQQLGLDPPAIRLKKLLNSEALKEDSEWTLSEPGTLGERSPNNTAWRFANMEERDDVEVMKFEGSALAPERSVGFIVPTEMVGRIAQFKRRIKALAALKNHGELLRMFADPRMRIENSQDTLDETTKAFIDLDSSKQSALREIMSTIPLFLLQGPPGVGKTYLVGDLVRRRMDDEPIARMLLSAQSNSAIDHLMNEVQSTFSDVEKDAHPLMVRARAADDDDSAGELEIDVQADKLLQDLASSPLVEEASELLAKKIVSLAKARSMQGKRPRPGPGGAKRISSELRSFEGMILRAANLVFATTNSAAVERLIEEQSLFDWTIVEEAGKATGGELLSPLLLSHRRLMIGDHKQLPPFDVDSMIRLLSSTDAVKNVVVLVDEFVSRYLKDPGIDEMLDEVSSSSEELGRTCSEALSYLTLFETFVEKELSRQSKKDRGPRIARRLNEQYRMHPTIAGMVSKCFYESSLQTNPKQKTKFETLVSPVISLEPKILPDLPLVFVDLPYAREEAPGGRGGERAPVWSNPDEVNATIQILKLLGVNQDAAPSLAVLSPYWQQVKRISRAIHQKRDDALSGLSAFYPAIDGKDFCGTVDSFQGGEADAVVVSLVRNNHHTTPSRALGFLRDNRRMNVLLSRAKWRLIIVGSLSFYRQVVSNTAKLPNQDIGFLNSFLEILDSETTSGNAAIIPWSKLKGVAS